MRSVIPRIFIILRRDGEETVDYMRRWCAEWDRGREREWDQVEYRYKWENPSVDQA